jgi:hypothetical protein
VCIAIERKETATSDGRLCQGVIEIAQIPADAAFTSA